MEGNVVDMAVGIVIGAAFSAIVSSLVKDVIMPPIGLALGRIDFSNLAVVLKEGTTPAPYSSLATAQAAGAVTLNYGLFINSVITFLIVVLSVFLLIIRPIAIMQARKPAAPPAAPNTKDCPYCAVSIPAKTTRCPQCTSQLG